MLVAQVLGSVLVLGWASTLQGLPILPAPLYPTQENFDLGRFMGKWYDVAKATNCPYERRTADPAIATLELKAGLDASKIQTLWSVLRDGVCKERTGDYEVTTTPGRFYQSMERWDAELDSYVVHTNYQEYAIMVTKRQNASISIKLLSRTKEVRDTVMADFKTLVSDMGIGEDRIVIKKDKGDCVPGEVKVTMGTPCFLNVQRKRRQADPSADPSDVVEEGSADMMPATMFTYEEGSCLAEPDSGPCFGALQRYVYNSTSMSCQEFQYGGCLGNQNNFQTERECLQRCRTEAACRLPLVPQPCTGLPDVWAFDTVLGLCLPYKKGICQGNGNRFYSKAECDEYCGVVTEEPELLAAN